MARETTKDITKTKILLVEGNHEQDLFSKLLHKLDLASDIQIVNAQGKDKYPTQLKAIMKMPGHELITSVGIVGDADDNPQRAFQNICKVLQEAKLPQPTAPLQPVKIDGLQVIVLILPDSQTKGMLETVCLESVKDDPAMICVNQYFECLEQKLDKDKLPKNMAKSKIQAFLASRHEFAVDLGVAAQKSYWQFDHPVFETIKQFLQQL